MPRSVAVGDVIPELTFTVEVGPMKVFSVLMDDPNPIHYDPEFVRSLGRGPEPVNQGTITARHRGGGHKRQLRLIDFRRSKDGVPAKVTVTSPTATGTGCLTPDWRSLSCREVHR